MGPQELLGSPVVGHPQLDDCKIGYKNKVPAIQPERFFKVGSRSCKVTLCYLQPCSGIQGVDQFAFCFRIGRIRSETLTQPFKYFSVELDSDRRRWISSTSGIGSGIA